MTLISAPPTRVPAVDYARFFSREWRDWNLEIYTVASNSPQKLGAALFLENQHANIVTTPLTLPAVSAGFYRISLYQTVTTVDGAASSLTTTIAWTDGGATKTFATAAMTGNTLATNDSMVRLIHIDNASPITYATVYASTTPNMMRYVLGILVESL